MASVVFRKIVLGVLAVCAGGAYAGGPRSSSTMPTGPIATTKSASRGFEVFQWTPYAQRLLAPGTGIRTVWLIEDGFWARGADGKWDRSRPDEKATRATAWFLARKGVPVVIDIEHWQVDVRYASEAEVRANLTKLAQIADWIHSERPGVKLGFYQLLPLQDYWTPVKYEGATRGGRVDKAVALERERWLKATAVVGEYLAGRVDYVFPSLYTFYDDRAGWKVYAAANIEAARKFGKPVYPFLWMNYDESNAKLKGRPLPRDVWREELEFCRQHADGLVIWGSGITGPDGRYTIPAWNEQWGWWQETMRFLDGAPGRVGGE